MGRKEAARSGWGSDALSRVGRFAMQPKPLLLVLLLLGTAAFSFYTIRRIWNHGKQTAAFQFNLSQLRPSRGIPWIRPEVFTNAFDADPFLSRSHSIFEAGVTARISETLEAIPWVRSVPYVRKSMPNRIELEIIPREPLLRVAGYGPNRSTMLADIDGVRLDASFYDFSNNDLVLFEVTGVVGPAPAIGRPWSDDAVRSAAAVARALKEWDQFDKTVRMYGNEVLAIDVSNFRRRRNRRQTNEIVLITRHGTRIKWGRSPASAFAEELPEKEKLRWLYRIYRIDNAQGNSTYDIRFRRYAFRRYASAF